MRVQPKNTILAAHTTAHGGFHAAEWHARELVDFSANINPFGASPHVRKALLRVPFERHPDPQASELRAALSQHLSLDANHITVGNGSLELIRNLAIAYVRQGDSCLVVGPTFGEYRVACELMGARVDEWRVAEHGGFVPDAQRIAAEIRRLQPRLVFICNPNNPTGVYLGRDDIATMLDACERSLLVLDEAFVQFVETRWDASELLGHEHLVLMRSMTKDYALAGARLGYALAHQAVAAALAKVQAPWSVNAFAQAAGLAVLDDDRHLRQSMALLRAAKQEFVAGLMRWGLVALPSAVHFFLVEVNDSRAFRSRLLTHGIVVRDCASFDLPLFVRIATQRPEHNARLLAALEATAS